MDLSVISTAAQIVNDATISHIEFRTHYLLRVMVKKTRVTMILVIVNMFDRKVHVSMVVL
jgi:hypothetical protein